MPSSTTKRPGQTKKPKAVKSKGQEYTRETVIAAFKSWAEQHDGQAPTSADFWLARLRQFSKAAETQKAAKAFERHAKAAEKAGYPIPPTVQRLFGSWAKGLQAAGLKRRQVERKTR